MSQGILLTSVDVGERSSSRLLTRDALDVWLGLVSLCFLHPVPVQIPGCFSGPALSRLLEGRSRLPNPDIRHLYSFESRL